MLDQELYLLVFETHLGVGVEVPARGLEGSTQLHLHSSGFILYIL